MKNPLSLLVPTLLAASLTAQFQPGNLVVLRVGDGVNPLSNASQALFLDEYTTSGAFVQSVALPTAANGAHLPIATSGSATSEGNLQLSADGRFLVLAGYAAAPGITSIASSSSATTPRVIARVGLDEVVDTTTSTTAFSGNNIRSATSTDGTEFFAVGANSGVQYLSFGSNTSTQLNTVLPLNTRTVQIAGGQLYCSSSSGAFLGVSTVGTGIPTTAGQTITSLPGMPLSAASTYDFFFADAATLYLADDRTTGSNGGIHKYTLSNGIWSLQYVLSPAATVGCRGLSGTVQNGIATLFATNTLTGTNEILTVTDLGAGSPFTTIAIAATNTVFRGLRRIPDQLARIPHGCGPTTITGTGTGALGSSVTTVLGGVVGVPFLGYGFAIGASPLCASCTLGHEWAALQFGGSSTLVLPTDPSFTGLSIGIQGADLLGVGGCAAPLVTLTDTLVVTIH